MVRSDSSIPDVEEAKYVRAHLAAMRDAFGDMVTVGGFFSWSLMDSVEWTWGYGKRLGLVRVDYATQERTPKTSALAYRRIIERHAL